MPTISDFLENLKKVDVKSLVKAVVNEHEIQIVDLNREDQIFKDGIDSKGQSLFNYAKATQKLYDKDAPSDSKGKDKGEGKRYNMFWSGESYISFYAYIKGDKLFITSSSRGRRLLIQHGGKEIFGLTNQNSERVNWEIIAPSLNERIRKQLL